MCVCVCVQVCAVGLCPVIYSHLLTISGCGVDGGAGKGWWGGKRGRRRCVRWEGETREGMWGRLKGGKGRVCGEERISRERVRRREIYMNAVVVNNQHMCVLIPLLPDL